VERFPDDPPGLSFETCAMRGKFKRYSVFGRVRQEIAYGLQAGRAIEARSPEVAILSNIPLLANVLVARRLRHKGIAMIFWHQDIYSEAIGVAARRRLPVIGGLAARVAEAVERTIARWSAAVVPISPTFLDKLTSWGVAEKATVVPNWAPVGELPLRPRHNAWSERMGLAQVPVVLYSGTLGLKHDPSILAAMVEELAVHRPEARVVVISEGQGRDWLENWRRENRAQNLVLLDYQPYTDLPEVLATGDILVAILEPDASKYSVPSKVLTYLCSGRPVVGVMPEDNSVAVVLRESGAGLVVDPRERGRIGATVASLLADDALRERLGCAGRRYAEAEFSPEGAADRFEDVIRPLLSSVPSVPSVP